MSQPSQIIIYKTEDGKISHALAVKKSEKEFEKFKAEQREIEKVESLKEMESDF